MISSADHSTRTLDIQSRTDLLEDVRAFISGAARDFGFSDDDVAKIVLAVDEACTNIIKHAYRYDPFGHIRITATSEPSVGARSQFVIRIMDNGRSFDTSSYHMPDMQEYFRQLRKGGLGILLMKKLMDEVDYEIRPGEPNVIRLVKYISAQRASSA